MLNSRMPYSGRKLVERSSPRVRWIDLRCLLRAARRYEGTGIVRTAGTERKSLRRLVCEIIAMKVDKGDDLKSSSYPRDEHGDEVENNVKKGRKRTGR